MALVDIAGGEACVERVTPAARADGTVYPVVESRIQSGRKGIAQFV